MLFFLLMTKIVTWHFFQKKKKDLIYAENKFGCGILKYRLLLMSASRLETFPFVSNVAL